MSLLFGGRRRAVWHECMLRNQSLVGNHEGTTLVIVDLQPQYPAACHQATIDAACNRVRHGREQGWGIVVVESFGKGPTHNDLLLAIAGYSRSKVVVKKENDGSVEVVALALQEMFSTMRFQVCGVTGVCVCETVFGLLQIAPGATVQVAQDACNGFLDSHWQSLGDSRIQII